LPHRRGRHRIGKPDARSGSHGDRHRRNELPGILSRHGGWKDYDAGLQPHPLDAVLGPRAQMTLTAGTKLGPHEILAPIGARGRVGAHGGRDRRLGGEVVIKVLPESSAQVRDRLPRFESEARAASALNHPNIITIHEIGSASGTSYIAMEYVDGTSLRELLAS